jgi:L-ascorbate metabolism protein UlaG (beta-lactamase superfamily)
MLIHPSANFVPGQFASLVGEVDVLYLGVGALGKQSEEFQERYWAETVGMVKPKVVVPIHWDDFGVPLEEGLRDLPEPFDDVGATRELIKLKSEGAEFVVRWPQALDTVEPFELVGQSRH